MATGEDGDIESLDLIMPKLLCGMPIISTIPNNIILLSREKKLAIEMLEALIEHWKNLKQINVNAFRNHFLRRNGSLRINKTNELTIETNAIDILLDGLPWSLSNIKLPWSHKMIIVTWQ